MEFVGAVTDVSERKLAEQVLRRSDAYLAEAQRLNRTGSWALKPGVTKPHYWSDEMFRIWGIDPQHWGSDWQSSMGRVHPDDLDRMRQLREQMFEGSITVDVDGEYRIVLPDGTLKHVHGMLHPVLDDGGRVVEYIGTVVDVTERKRGEEALRRSEAYLAEAQRLSHTGSWALDPFAGKIIYYSEEMYRIMGLDPALGPPDGEALSQRTHPEDLPLLIEGMNRIRSAAEKVRFVTGQTTSSPTFEALANELQDPKSPVGGDFDLRVVLPDGTLRYVRSYGHPIFDKTGQLTEFVGTAIDVTEQKQAEFERERLRQLEADLAHVNRVSMLGELAASIAHELKQPIAAGITSAGTTLRWLALDPPNIEDARETATAALKAGRRAAEIIDRLRALYTKAAAKRELLDGNEIILEMAALLSVEANRYKVSMHTDLAAEVPMIMADRVQVQHESDAERG